jgi:uncharacterized protein
VYYEVYRDAGGYWRWRYVASNGRIIADSGESYVNKTDCLHGVALTKSSFNAPIYGA